MDKITNNIVNNLPKKDVKDLKPSSDYKVKLVEDQIMSSNVVDIKNTKTLVKEMGQSAPLMLIKLRNKRGYIIWCYLLI